MFNKNLHILIFFCTFVAKLKITIIMRKIITLLSIACVSACMYAQDQQRYVGGDISMLPAYEKHNSYYKDVNGAKINNLITWLMEDCHWNTFRVRIFVHPNQTSKGQVDPSVCQDLAYVTTLGKRIKDAGGYFMLDFHYSDEWVDATHIQAPKAWKGASDEVMADSVATYTRKVLTALNAAGATPDLVQVGNEIMYGLCDIKIHPNDTVNGNWNGYLGLLKAGCNTVRELCPEAKIIIHTDRPTNATYNFRYYNKLRKNGVDFDIIGLSYYPFWHGYLTSEQVKDKQDKNNLVRAIDYLKSQFPEKEVQIVECAYNFQYWPSSGVNYDTRDVWACSVAGQYNFVKDLVDALKPLDNVTGISYWFPEEAGNGDDTNWNTSKGTVLTTWLNRGFWNEGATSAGHAINKTGSVTGDKTAADVCAPYYLGTFLPAEPQGITETQTTVKAAKTLRDGQLVIECNGQTFNVLGQTL